MHRIRLRGGAREKRQQSDSKLQCCTRQSLLRKTSFPPQVSAAQLVEAGVSGPIGAMTSRLFARGNSARATVASQAAKQTRQKEIDARKMRHSLFISNYISICPGIRAGLCGVVGSISIKNSAGRQFEASHTLSIRELCQHCGARLHAVVRFPHTKRAKAP